MTLTQFPYFASSEDVHGDGDALTELVRMFRLPGYARAFTQIAQERSNAEIYRLFLIEQAVFSG